MLLRTRADEPIQASATSAFTRVFDALCARTYKAAALAARHSASKTRVNALMARQRGWEPKGH